MQSERYPGSAVGKIANFWTGVGGLLLLIGLVVVVGTVSWQTYHWLQTDRWMPIKVADGLAYFQIAELQTEWLGVNHAIDWLCEQSLAAAAFLLAIFLGSVAAYVGGHYQREELKRQQKWHDERFLRERTEQLSRLQR